MLNVSRIIRDYADAGSVNGLLALWGFVDDQTFLTKGGHVGVVYRLTGVDYECLDQIQRRDVVHRFEGAIRLLDESCRVYQYLVKRRIAPFETGTYGNPVVEAALRRRTDYLNDRRDQLFDASIYLVLLYEGSHPPRRSTPLPGLWTRPHAALRDWLSPQAILTLLEREIDESVAQLHRRAAAFEIQLADSVRPQRLYKADAFRFFQGLVNYGPEPRAGLRYDTHLDYFVGDSPIECHRDHLDVGAACVKVLTMKEPPSATFAHLLEDLYTVSGEFIACLEWRRIASDRMRRDLQLRRRHFFNKRVSLVNYVSTETRPEDMLVDDSATTTVKQLGDAMTELEVNGHFFGECSLTLVLFDGNPQEVERTTAEATKAMAAHDAAFTSETYNLLNAWLSIVPGNSAHNLRRLALLETNYADLSFLFTLDRGEPVSRHLGQEALAVFETRHQAPYHFNLHVDDVANTLVLGAIGSGKSFLLNFLLLHAQKYEALTVILDLGRSYQKLATLLHGSYVELGLRQPEATINPFALEPTPENLHFLHAFARVLLEGADGYRLSDAEGRELYEAIENIFVLEPAQRRLLTLANLLPRALATRMGKWIDGGRYADLFDHAEDTLSVQSFQVFEFEAMRAYPDLLQPLLFYVLHRVTARVNDLAASATLKLCVLDEAWRFIQHETLRAYVQEALKTWRKRNAAMVLATQTIDDFASADLLRTVVESCPTKLLLANPGLDRAQYADLFRLNETELDLLTTLIPRRQLLLKRPDLAKVLNLSVAPTGSTRTRRSTTNGHGRSCRNSDSKRAWIGSPHQPDRRSFHAYVIPAPRRPAAAPCHWRRRRPGDGHPRRLSVRAQRDAGRHEASVHDDDRASGAGRDRRRRLRRPRLLGDLGHPEHRACEAGEAGRRDQPQSRHHQRRRLLVPVVGRWHCPTGPQAVCHERSDDRELETEVLLGRPCRGPPGATGRVPGRSRRRAAARRRRRRDLQAAVPNAAPVCFRHGEVRAAVLRPLHLARRPVDLHPLRGQ
jgi:type IV secretion/conjugal transfer VirB4 family ATPase